MKISDIICHDIGFHYYVNFKIEYFEDEIYGKYNFESNSIIIYLSTVINKCIECIPKKGGILYKIDHVTTISALIYVITHELMHSLLLISDDPLIVEYITDMNAFKFITNHKNIFDLIIKDSICCYYPFIQTIDFYDFNINRSAQYSDFLESIVYMNDPKLDYKNISKERYIMYLLERIAIPNYKLYYESISNNIILDINVNLDKKINSGLTNNKFTFNLKNNGEYSLDFLPVLNSILNQTLYNDYKINYNISFDNKDTIRLSLTVSIYDGYPLYFYD